jgi:hypothetical protein
MKRVVLVLSLAVMTAVAQVSKIVPGSGVTVYPSTGRGSVTISAQGGPGARTIPWDSVTGKPSTFTPATHSQSIASITGLPDSIAAKAASGHNHSGTYLPLHSLADSVPWAGIKNAPATYAPSSHYHFIPDIYYLQDSLNAKAAAGHNHSGIYLPLHAPADSVPWAGVKNPPAIPAPFDSALAAANSWKLGGYTPDFRVDLLAESLFVKLPATGKAADAACADSARGGAARVGGFDTLGLTRTSRPVRILVDTVKTIAAKRTPIFFSGLKTTDRAWVSWADSVSGSRRRGQSAVCKVNTLVVFADTTAGILNIQILR